jgi:hypothetical protein
VNGKSVKHKFFLAQLQINGDGVLGLYFLRRLGFIIETANKLTSGINTKKIQLKLIDTNRTKTQGMVLSKGVIRIPAHSEAVITGKKGNGYLNLKNLMKLR